MWHEKQARTRLKTTPLRTACVLVGLTIGVGAALAHGGATGIVKERMDAMERIAEHTKVLKAIFIDGKEDLGNDASVAALSIVGDSGAAMVSLFPEGSLDHPTEALPAIWQNWDDFTAQAKALRTRAQALALNPSREGFLAMAETCKTCHDAYRLEK